MRRRKRIIIIIRRRNGAKTISLQTSFGDLIRIIIIRRRRRIRAKTICLTNFVWEP